VNVSKFKLKFKLRMSGSKFKLGTSSMSIVAVSSRWERAAEWEWTLPEDAVAEGSLTKISECGLRSEAALLRQL